MLNGTPVSKGSMFSYMLAINAQALRAASAPTTSKRLRLFNRKTRITERGSLE